MEGKLRKVCLSSSSFAKRPHKRYRDHLHALDLHLFQTTAFHFRRCDSHELREDLMELAMSWQKRLCIYMIMNYSSYCTSGS